METTTYYDTFGIAWAFLLPAYSKERCWPKFPHLLRFAVQTAKSCHLKDRKQFPLPRVGALRWGSCQTLLHHVSNWVNHTGHPGVLSYLHLFLNGKLCEDLVLEMK